MLVVYDHCISKGRFRFMSDAQSASRSLGGPTTGGIDMRQCGVKVWHRTTTYDGRNTCSTDVTRAIPSRGLASKTKNTCDDETKKNISKYFLECAVSSV